MSIPLGLAAKRGPTY